MTRRRTSLLALLFGAILVLAACGAAGSALQPIGRPVAGGAEQPGPATGGNDGAGNGGTAGNGTGGLSGAPGNTTRYYDVNRPDLLIVKTGQLGLEVASIDDAVSTAATKVAGLGGYVAGSQRSGADDQQTASVVYRIPAARWDEALAALRGLGTKVLSEQSSTDDVTGEVLDLGARITNLQATEKALQAIIAKADKIPDVLAVQSELTKVRGEIEQLSTQKKHLEAQAAFSTLTVSYALKAPAAVIASQKDFDPSSVVDEATASLVDVLQALATAGIWFAIVWLPILLVLGAVGLVAYAVLRRLRRFPPAPAAPAATVSGEG